jgi:hypothetical protein
MQRPRDWLDGRPFSVDHAPGKIKVLRNVKERGDATP